MSAEIALSDEGVIDAEATGADDEEAAAGAAVDAFEDELGCCSGWQGHVLLLFLTSLFSK